MIEGAPAVPYKFRSYGNVYCISSCYVGVVMKIEIWRTEAWCGMIMRWVPPEAIPYAFDANSKECWHCDKKRHAILDDQCHDVTILHLAAKHEKEIKNHLLAEAAQTELEKSAPSAADAAASEPNKMPKLAGAHP